MAPGELEPDDHLRDAVQRLLDFEAIRVLKSRYLRFLDEKAWDEWSALFTADVRFDYPLTGAHQGREELLRRVKELEDGGHSVHHCHTPEIQLTSSSTAVGIWAMADEVERAVRNGGRVQLQGYGYYHEEYQKIDGLWKISSLRLVRTRVVTSELKSSHLAYGPSEGQVSLR